MRLLLLFAFIITFFTQVSCKKYVAADEAFFLKPGLISVATSPSQGSGNHRITDLWVYVDGQFTGAYSVDGQIPIITKGKSVKLNVFAGIVNNGIKDTRVFSPFYELLDFDTLVPNRSTISRPFTFTYRAGTTFTWTEGFESLGFSIIKSSTSDTGFVVSKDSNGIEGGYLRLTGSNTATRLQIESAGSGFALPLGNPNLYMEINYKCNYDVTVGVFTGIGEDKEVMHLNPQTNWNKIYISMADAVNRSPASAKHKVYFRIIKAGDAPPELCLDNIKLMYL